MATVDEQGPLGRRAAQRLTKHGLRLRNAAVLIITAWLFFIVIFAVIEHLVDGKTFGTIWEGMWWGTQTVTTVGYGDVTPQNTIGKAIAVILMLGGLSLIAVFTAIITSAFVDRAQTERAKQREDPVTQQLERLTAEIAQLKAELERSHRSDSS